MLVDVIVCLGCKLNSLADAKGIPKIRYFCIPDMNTQNDPYTILLADDHPLILEALTSLIHSFTPYKVIAVAKDGRTVLHKLNSMQPDLILLDINMPKLNGIKAALQVREKYPHIKIVFLSSYYDITYSSIFNETRADGFIPKLAEPEVFIKTLKQIVGGKKVFVKIETSEKKTQPDPDKYGKQLKLSTRELEIIQLIKQGLSTKEIADKLFLSVYTIDTHRKNICRKLGITSPNGLMKWVLENSYE